jgi:predicted O-linked N-acetylglucosamine transferase (SPINDLY family)
MPGQEADTFFNHANSLKAAGRTDEAIAAYRRALTARPDFIDAHIRLGNTLAAAGKHEEAAQSYRQVLRLQPNHLDALNNLANTLLLGNKPQEAMPMYRRVLAARPDHFLAWNNLSAALVAAGEFTQAIDAARRAMAIRQDYPPLQRNLGDAHSGLSQWVQAAESYRKLLDLERLSPGPPGFAADARTRLGVVLKNLGRIDEAIATFRDVINSAPDNLQARDELANLYWQGGDMDMALAECKKTVELFPKSTQAHNALGNVYMETGRLTEAIASYEKALQLNPTNFIAHDHNVFSILFHPDYDSARILEETRRWAARHGAPRPIQPHHNNRDPNRPLKIGYVSPDFRDHVVGRNILPLLKNRDSQNFQIYCYSGTTDFDRFNRQFRDLADFWHDTGYWTDEKLAAQIRTDGIDILVDLSLHLGGNRLPVFAHKPAPVQVTFAGYPGTTGVSAIDYRLTDPYLDPDAASEAFYTEKTICLPHSFWCYDPVATELDTEPDPGLPPAAASGQITFGCLNSFRKINPVVLKLWAAVMNRIPNSRLLVLSPLGAHRDALVQNLSQHGINPTCVGFVDRGTRRDYLDAYRRIDIALDTLPYNGHTTSLDALWMGVPVVTLIGKTIAGRAGWSQACNLDLKDLVAKTDEEFIDIAVNLAENLPRLTELRSSLRTRMRASPICDAKGWTRAIEAAYRKMWTAWVKAPSIPAPGTPGEG